MNIAVFGACSAIAEAVCRNFATRNANFILVARNKDKLDAVASDLKVRGASEVKTIACELADTQTHADLFRQIDNPDLVFIAYGHLPEQAECNKNFSEIEHTIQVNFTSVCSILNHYANYFENKKSGTIAVITSVAGDRGRQSNFAYGSSKGALSIFLQGLRNRLSPYGICVLDIKPGFISTPMTANLKQGLLFSSPETAGKCITKAIDKKRDCVYVPGFWAVIMLVIRLIPEFIFKKLKL